MNDDFEVRPSTTSYRRSNGAIAKTNQIDSDSLRWRSTRDESGSRWTKNHVTQTVLRIGRTVWLLPFALVSIENSAPTHLSRSATRSSAATVTAGAVRCRLASDGRAHRARLSVARSQKHQGHGEVLLAVGPGEAGAVGGGR